MLRHNRPIHKFTRSLQPVKVIINDTIHVGLVISRFHKIPKKSTTEEPFYTITGLGQPVWEGHIVPITDEEYNIAEGGE
jgi:hypothetical protein